MSRIIFLLTLSYFYVNCHICGTMNLKNDVESLKNLRNCTEIAGSLQIVLMETVQNFDDYVFPELKIISGYLMLFRVANLKSVGQLFPNLYLILGKELFLDYSLIIYNMPDINQIGTVNLFSIARGLVLIDKNPNLCFVHTINWSALGVEQPKIRVDKVCGRCPLKCAEFCWNATHCQKPIENDCHSECLGCYEKNSARQCKVCKHYDDDGICVSSCPPNKYIHTLLKKCVTKDTCENLLSKKWWVHNWHCVDECPELYNQEIHPNGSLKNGCKFCGEKCRKDCNLDEEINAMSQLQQLKGCTHINGSLIIKMTNIELSNLTEFLGNVRYISGMLMIARTMRLNALEFLKKIVYIGTDNNKEMEMYANYSIFMYENQNLQQLWNFTSPNVTLKGTIGFHDNPLLCLTEIKRLANATNVVYTDLNVSPFSNGDKASCVTKKINVIVTPNSVNSSITWDPPILETTERYIGYAVFYKQGENGNATTFDSKDVCVGNEWTSTFTTNNSIVLINLFPNSSYAYYIKMYISSNFSTQGYHSEMKYFETLPDDPDRFDFLTITPIDHQSVMLNWEKPKLPNGVLAHYVLDFDQLQDESMYDRDYCLHPKTSYVAKVDDDGKEKDFRIDSKGYNKTLLSQLEANCKCAKPKTGQSEKEITIVTKDEQFDVCRVLLESGKSKCKNLQYTYDSIYRQTKRNNNQQLIPANETSHNITNLSPFTLYVFYFSACNHPLNEHHCSGVLQRFARTLKKPNADDVENLEVIPEGKNAVKLSWTKPRHPNSNIVAYRISLNSSITALHTDCFTVNRSQRNKREFSKIYNGLRPGEYTVSVVAESLAGLSDIPQRENFKVEEVKNQHTVIITMVVVCLLSLIIIGMYVYFKKFRAFRGPTLISSINPEYVGIQYVQDEWEMERSDIEFVKGLGKGTFGTVLQGKIKSRNNLPCAIKTVNENLGLHDKMKFLNEASVMKNFSDCYHVVKLLGVVSASNPPLVIMELMERGDLKTCLRKTRDSSHNLTSNEIYRMAVEIADGMAYLSAKKFIHRDLAARNCMVAADRTVKVGDFGMARDIYETDYYRKETKGLLPVRWMAPESLADGVFTTDSDVWSFGIVLWEIATLAEQPYQGLSNEQVLQFVISRGRLTRPQECSDLLYDVMRKCWSWRPFDRPSFWDIVELLENRVSEDFKLVAFVYSREAALYSRQRTENPAALSSEPREELLCHYNTDDEEVSLHVGGVPRRSRYQHGSLN